MAKSSTLMGLPVGVSGEVVFTVDK